MATFLHVYNNVLNLRIICLRISVHWAVTDTWDKENNSSRGKIGEKDRKIVNDSEIDCCKSVVGMSER